MLTSPPLSSMATIVSPSSASPHEDGDNIPTATLALPSVSAVAAPRRLPPPCWSPEETVALIDAYRDKWYALRRGNLRANHWQEVADDIASRCPASPPKTAVQCRHKMEKLRKRYRGEIQRAAAHGGVRRYSSPWVHFQSFHSMEKGPNPTPPTSDDDDEEDDDHKNSIKRINDLYDYNKKCLSRSRGHDFESNGATSGVRIRIPGMATAGPPMAKVYSKFHGIRGQNPHNPNPRFSSASKVFGDGSVVSNMSKRKAAVDKAVAAIQSLGEGFMRIEKVKMDMVKRIEEMRMEMELKRTETIIESQQRIVEAFADAISARSSKRAKRNSPPPDC